MKVSVVCFGALRDYLPAGATGNRASLEIKDEAIVADVGAAIGAPERLMFAVLVNGEQAERGSRLSQGDEVALMPPFAGGQRRRLRFPTRSE